MHDRFAFFIYEKEIRNRMNFDGVAFCYQLLVVSDTLAKFSVFKRYNFWKTTSNSLV